MLDQELLRAFVLCVRNDGYAASLEPRKVYQTLRDDVAEAKGFRRVIDESGEDYLFPADFFVTIDVPLAAVEAFAESS